MIPCTYNFVNCFQLKLFIAYSQVIQINPNTGEFLRSVSIPASLVTSVTLGGRLLNILFVGTMRSDNLTLVEPLAGSVFAVDGLGVFGFREKEAVVNNFCKPAYF